MLISLKISDREFYKTVLHDLKSLNKILHGCIKFRYITWPFGENLTFLNKILFTGGQEEGIKTKVVNILNIPAVFFAFSFCIDKSFFLPNLNQLSICLIASSHRQRKWVLCAPRHCGKWKKELDWCSNNKEAKRRVSSLVNLLQNLSLNNMLTMTFIEASCRRQCTLLDFLMSLIGLTATSMSDHFLRTSEKVGAHY